MHKSFAGKVGYMHPCPMSLHCKGSQSLITKLDVQMELHELRAEVIKVVQKPQQVRHYLLV